MKTAGRCLAFLFAGLGFAALAGCASAPPTTFDFPAETRAGILRPGAQQIVIAEPFAPRHLDSDAMIVRDAGGTISFVGGAQWSDRVPVLVQSRLVRAFEATGRSVARAGTGSAADLVLRSEIAAFEVRLGATPSIVIGITVTLFDERAGRIAASRSFRVERPIAALAGSDIATAFGTAMSGLMPEIVRWAASIA